MAHVPPPQRLHHPPDGACVLRRHQQVHVIGHQHVGMHATAEFQARLAQRAQVIAVVVRLEEARLAIVATLHHVLGHARKIKSIRSWLRRRPFRGRPSSPPMLMPRDQDQCRRPVRKRTLTPVFHFGLISL
jgi:hypothetical protein